MSRPYQQPGVTLARGGNNDPAHVRALQHDLRALGYLRSGIDGKFGGQTADAVRALQIDLLRNDGSGRDGNAPVAIMSFNADATGAQPVTLVDGVLDQGLASCIAALMDDSRICKLPRADDPVKENKKALAVVDSSTGMLAPGPFIAAMILQESDGKHYNVPPPGDDDRFVKVGLDYGLPEEDGRVTSRGYGIGQYTLFHHPPRADEVANFIEDPVRNVQHAFAELREKFDRFVAGPASRADDRDAEHPRAALRLCRYESSDDRYMRDCKACAASTSKSNIVPGTPVYPGASLTFRVQAPYSTATYNNVPTRAEFLCDWPYAARRYNGGGILSYHYQTRILLNLMR